jgi:hypothetical protein
MIKLISAILLISFSINVNAQSLVNDSNCNFLKNVRFKNGIDTLVIKACFKDINPLPSSGYLDELKEYGINKNKFNYQLVFEPENCSKEYIGPSSASNVNKILRKNPYPLFLTLTVYVTCVVFEKYSYDNEGAPYFVVIKIATKKPAGFK